MHTQEDAMTNRFKDPTMRKEYENATACFLRKHRNLFLADGTRISGARPAGELDRLLNEAEARCAKGGKAIC